MVTMPTERRDAHISGASRKRAGGAQRLRDDVAEALRVVRLPTNEARRKRLETIAARDGEDRAQVIRTAAWLALRNER